MNRNNTHIMIEFYNLGVEQLSTNTRLWAEEIEININPNNSVKISDGSGNWIEVGKLSVGDREQENLNRPNWFGMNFHFDWTTIDDKDKKNLFDYWQDNGSDNSVEIMVSGIDIELNDFRYINLDNPPITIADDDWDGIDDPDEPDWDDDDDNENEDRLDDFELHFSNIVGKEFESTKTDIFYNYKVWQSYD
jgi:hypothetical protein